MSRDGLKLPRLFLEFLCLSSFVIGGGYAIIAVADRVFARLGWTDEGELLDHLPVFQMVPGLIATHTAVYVGRKVAGGIGAVTAVAAVALPSVVIFTFVSLGYDRLPLDNPILAGAFTGLRAALTGIIAATVVRSWRRTLRDGFAYGVMIAAGALIAFGNVNVALVLVGAAVLGVLRGRLSPSGPARVRCAAWLPLLVFLKYGVLGFGGGFVLVPMYLQDFVGAHAPYLQVGEETFSNVMALSQMTPGPIGVNAATFFGFGLAGVPGALVASALLLLPGSLGVYFVIRSLERFQANRFVQGLLAGIRPATVAMMLVALAAFASSSCTSAPGVVLTLLAAALMLWKRVNVIALILGSGAVGSVYGWLT